jgi:hypothetical protein
MEATHQRARFMEQVEQWPTIEGGSEQVQLIYNCTTSGTHLSPPEKIASRTKRHPTLLATRIASETWPGLSESRPKPTRRLVSSASKSEDDPTLQTKAVLIVIDASVKRTAIGKAGVEILSLDSAQGDIPVQSEVKASTDRKSKSILREITAAGMISAVEIGACAAESKAGSTEIEVKEWMERGVVPKCKSWSKQIGVLTPAGNSVIQAKRVTECLAVAQISRKTERTGYVISECAAASSAVKALACDRSADKHELRRYFTLWVLGLCHG